MLYMCIFYISLMAYITHESMLEEKNTKVTNAPCIL